jgi:hypothetical protein
MSAPENAARAAPERKTRKPMVAPVQPFVLCEEEAARVIGRSPSWMRQRRFQDGKLMREGKAPTGPVWVAVESSIFYRVADLQAWLDENAVERGQVAWRGKDEEVAP